MGRGIAAAGEAVMLRDLLVREQSIAGRPSTVVGSRSEPSTAGEFSCCFVGRLVASHPSVGRSPDDVDWLMRGILEDNFECRSRNATANEVLNGRLRISDYNVWLRPSDKGQGYCRLFRRCGVRCPYGKGSDWGRVGVSDHCESKSFRVSVLRGVYIHGGGGDGVFI